MKKTSIPLCRLRTLPVLTMLIFSALLSSLLSSCSGDKADVSELLATVPADASAVISINVKDLVEKAGCKIEGSAIVPGKEVEALITQNDSAATDSSKIQEIFNGNSGIDPTVALIFMEGSELYFTGFAADPNKFRQFAKNEFGEEFEKADDIETLGNVALKGNQFWIHANHRNDISREQIKRFVSLDDKLSFLSNPYSDKIAKFDHDLEGWANLSSLYNASGMSFQQRAMTGMALAILFSDAQDIAFYADFDKGKLATSLSVLNSKGIPAKFNLPTDRIDTGLVKNLCHSSDNVIAMAISPKLIEQMQKNLGNQNIPGMSLLMPALSALDGTSVVAFSEETMKGVVSTKGEATAALSDLITQLADVTVTKDGKLLRFEKGVMSGSLNNNDVAEQFKGAMFAMISSSNHIPGMELPEMTGNRFLTTLTPDEGSLRLDAIVFSGNEKENFLLSVIKEKLRYDLLPIKK